MAGFTLRPPESPENTDGIWTAYGPPPTPDEQAQGIVQERYKIRLLSPKDTDHFKLMATQGNKRWERHQLVEEPDEQRYEELLYDHMIEDWDGVYQDDAKTILAPCTLANKYMLMKNSLDRQNFIILRGSLYANDDNARKAAQRESFRQSPEVSVGLPGADV